MTTSGPDDIRDDSGAVPAARFDAAERGQGTRRAAEPRVDGAAAVLVDAQTAPRFVGSGGLNPILDEVAGSARIVVRRAYGRWFGPEMREAQNRLARLGFELIHTFAPLPSNRPSTVQLVVDALELAARPDRPSWMILVSAECDLAPLARRLQQIGLRVMVVGPRGVADRTVRTCCDKLVLFDRPDDAAPARDGKPASPRPGPRRADSMPAAVRNGPAAGAPRPAPPAAPDAPARGAASAAHRAAREILAAAGGVADCLRLRTDLLQRLPDFDEQAMGYGDFLGFVRADRGLAVEFDDGTWIVRLRKDAPALEVAPRPAAGPAEPPQGWAGDAPQRRQASRPVPVPDDPLERPAEAPAVAGPLPTPPAGATEKAAARPATVQTGSPFYGAAPSTQVYAGLLRKLDWDFADADTVRAVVAAFPEEGLPAARAEMFAWMRRNLAQTVDDRALRRALSALTKSQCLERREGGGAGQDSRVLRPGLTAEQAVTRIDQAMLSRLRSICESYRVDWDIAAARPLLLGDHPEDEPEASGRPAGVPAVG